MNGYTTAYCNTGTFNYVNSLNLINSAIQTSNLVTNTLDSASLVVANVNPVNLDIDNVSFASLNATNMNISTGIQGTTMYVGQMGVSGALNCTSVHADIVFSQRVAATGFTGGTLNVAQLNCNQLVTSDLLISGMYITGSYFSTGSLTLTGLSSQINITSVPQTGPRLVTKQLTNGYIDNSTAYTLVSSTNSVLSDLLVVVPYTTGKVKPLLYAHGIQQNANESIGQIVNYNYQLAASGVLDVGTGYGGQLAYLSLNVGTGGVYRTLRYQQNGELAIYSDPNTILWQSNNMVSDKRLKHNIEPILDASSVLEQLHPVYYEFIDKSISNEEQIGFIAQELEQHIPAAVIKQDNLNYIVQMEKIIPYLIESIKTL